MLLNSTTSLKKIGADSVTSLAGSMILGDPANADISSGLTPEEQDAITTHEINQAKIRAQAEKELADDAEGKRQAAARWEKDKESLKNTFGDIYRKINNDPVIKHIRLGVTDNINAITNGISDGTNFVRDRWHNFWNNPAAEAAAARREEEANEKAFEQEVAKTKEKLIAERNAAKAQEAAQQHRDEINEYHAAKAKKIRDFNAMQFHQGTIGKNYSNILDNPSTREELLLDKGSLSAGISHGEGMRLARRNHELVEELTNRPLEEQPKALPEIGEKHKIIGKLENVPAIPKQYESFYDDTAQVEEPLKPSRAETPEIPHDKGNSYTGRDIIGVTPAPKASGNMGADIAGLRRAEQAIGAEGRSASELLKHLGIGGAGTALSAYGLHKIHKASKARRAAREAHLERLLRSIR